jgi:hypothetical protein
LQDLAKHRYFVSRLPFETGAEDIGGFTPLAHGVPEFYEADGDRVPAQKKLYSRPSAPFEALQNLPEARKYVAGAPER